MDDKEMLRMLIERTFERLNSDKKLKKKLSGYSADRLPSKEFLNDLLKEYQGTETYKEIYRLYHQVELNGRNYF